MSVHPSSNNVPHHPLTSRQHPTSCNILHYRSIIERYEAPYPTDSSSGMFMYTKGAAISRHVFLPSCHFINVASVHEYGMNEKHDASNTVIFDSLLLSHHNSIRLAFNLEDLSSYCASFFKMYGPERVHGLKSLFTYRIVFVSTSERCTSIFCSDIAFVWDIYNPGSVISCALINAHPRECGN
jgi:hypothetical protein